MNTVALIGRLTYNPELKSTSSGVSVVRFQLAVDRNYQAQGTERQADFIDCVAWRQTADFVSKYFHRGDMLALTGEIQTTNYEKDGQKRKSVEVVANNISFCGKKEKAEEADFVEITDDKMPWD